MTRYAARIRAFTLVEATVCVALVGIMLVAATGTFGQIAKTRRQQAEGRQAILLAQSLLAEVMRQPFSPAASHTSRATFNCIDDYNGYTAAPPVSGTGSPVGGYNRWTEQVSIAYVDPANPLNAASSSTLKSINVTVIAPSSKKYTLIGFRSQFGPYEPVPSLSTTYVTGATITLEGTDPSQAIYAGAHPLNEWRSQP